MDSTNHPTYTDNIDKIAHRQDYTGEAMPTPECVPLTYPYGPAKTPKTTIDPATG